MRRMLEVGLREGELWTWRRPFAFTYDLDRKLIASQLAGLCILFRVKPRITIMQLRNPKWWELRAFIFLWGILSLEVVVPIWKYREA